MKMQKLVPSRLSVAHPTQRSSGDYSTLGRRWDCPFGHLSEIVGRLWGEHRIGEVPRMLDRLPVKSDPATTKTIENIDVLWLKKHAILAGIEVEHTTSIYSGLLRMSDLLTMQPNIEIRLYLVAPDERAVKFAREVARTSSFSSLPKPMHTLCRFLPYSNLLETLNKVGDFVHRLNPEFLDDISDLYDPAVSPVD